MRDFLDEILAFIGSESLTDEEFDLLTLSEAAYNKATFDELKLILEMRENVTDQVARLRAFFIAKGESLSDDGPTPMSNIYIGSKLQ